MNRPVRIAHLGLGAFFRAHQAWYTAHAPDADSWGIAAFTGRSPAMADALNAQGRRYTLIARRAEGDHAEIIPVVTEAHPGGDDEAWHATMSAPELAVVTLTVTEAGYEPTSAIPGRLLAGLRARRAAGGGPLALVSCDNLPENGNALRIAVQGAAGDDADLREWIDAHISFVSTVVDRITPATTPEDRAVAQALTGWADRCPVVTEPFSEWLLAGEFPSGRPQWDVAGARFIDDVEVYERRKLWLLNGAHSLLAYAGATRGHATVAEAMHDEVCAAWVEQWWDAAARHLELDGTEVSDYRAALTARFTNPRIQHQLAQIGMDGSRKLPVRAFPVLRAELAAGREAVGPARLLAGWIRHLRGDTFEVRDPSAGEFTEAARGPLDQAVRSVLGGLDEELAADDRVVRLVADLTTELSP
ncbi:mannitol dehydrogenase family protein [Phytoactinopolyspora alkaliphila]|uniref:mannitol dehydrogenase family protein n=1 Tax=Phytoactinopolyspora alkaliphila TaxID=1783498 RepID=UPI001C20C3D7